MNLTKSMEINSQGVLKIGDFTVNELVRKYGTPLLVYDEAALRDNIQRFTKIFAENYSDFTVAYAAKAFLNRTLCRILKDEGTGLDVVSGGELFIALSAGFPAEKIYFHGNNKSREEIKMALEHDIGRFMVDNGQEAATLEEMAAEFDKEIKVILRVIPGIEAHTHEYIKTGHQDSKFGVSLAGGAAMELIEIIANYKHLSLTGLHAHIGSQIYDLKSYELLINIMFSFMNKLRHNSGIIIEELDLGGGFGIPHLEEEQKEIAEIEEFVRVIVDEVESEADRLDFPLPRIIVEPGRSIVGTTAITLYTVGTIKNNNGISKYLAIDGGMTDNIRPALYQAEYEGLLANRANEEPCEEVTIAGKCCESGDVLIKNIKLPEAKTGDILAVSATGAYTYSMSSNYNGLKRPAIVLVNGDKVNLMVKRESYEDLIRNDIIPEEY